MQSTAAGEKRIACIVRGENRWTRVNRPTWIASSGISASVAVFVLYWVSQKPRPWFRIDLNALHCLARGTSATVSQRSDRIFDGWRHPLRFKQTVRCLFEHRKHLFLAEVYYLPVAARSCPNVSKDFPLIQYQNGRWCSSYVFAN